MKGVQYTPYEHSLTKAVCKGRIEKVREIIRSHSQYYSKEWSDASDGYVLLCTAIENKHTEIAKLLLTNGSRVNSKNKNPSETPLHFAVEKGNINSIQKLLHQGANIDAKNSYGITALHIAVVFQKIEIISILLNEGASFKDTYEYNVAPLHLAAINGSEEIIKMLLSKGANVNAKAKGGITSLLILLDCRRKEIAEHRLKYGANVNNVYNTFGSKKDYTPLHFAAENGHLDVIELLLKYGANVNYIDEYGLTALEIALKNGHEEIVMALLEHGSDITITSKKNYTAHDSAMHLRKAFRNNYFYYIYGQLNVVKILKCRMVKIKVANLYAVNKNILSIFSRKFDSDDEKLSDFQNKCEKEIASMKSEVINDNITFYDILTGSVCQVAMYATNESIVKALGSDNYKIKFPIYASMIKRNFRKGEKEIAFMEKGDKIFGFLFSKNFPWLPRDCTEKILSYLNYEDLLLIY